MATYLTLLAATLLATWHLTASFAHRINVRWQLDVTDARRVELERRFALVKGERRDDRGTWSYDLLDQSRENVRALVDAREAADTHEIDRQTFQLSVSGPRGETTRWPGRQLPFIGTFEGVRRVVLTLVALVLAALALPLGRGTSSPPALLSTCGLVMLVALGSHPEVGLLQARHSPATPEGLRSTFECRTGERFSCPLPGDLIAWIETQLPADAVFATNTENQLPPSLFVPQQFVGWSGLSTNFGFNLERVFGPYLPFYKEAQRVHGGQPFFNAHDSLSQRLEFVRRLGVTHILVDPVFYDTIRPVLLENGRYFEQLYDRDRWAVYLVRREALGM
jgi:hypothetical protein